MKKSEIATIILIASLSMFATFFIARALIGGDIKKEAVVRKATPIDQDVTRPSKTVFNKDSINPTVEVFVQRTEQQSVANKQGK